MEGFNSPSPQPEDPGRAFDPGLEEDPDISAELVNRTFYQANYDGASVAIIADYPGPLPTSRVSKAETLSSEEDSFLIPCLMHKISYFYRDDLRNAVPSPWGLVGRGLPGQAGLRGRRLGPKRRYRGMVKTCSVIIVFEM